MGRQVGAAGVVRPAPAARCADRGVLRDRPLLRPERPRRVPGRRRRTARRAAGRPAPLAGDATGDGRFLALLEDAARACLGRGERLVLLVDGLDEDRGVADGRLRYSIAGLLPARPPPGMRVVVAGRPNPPVPADVLDDHPLRDPGVVRVLTLSRHAAMVRADAERDLRRLIAGSPAEQDLLGLITAAGGGLSGADLAELTGLDRWQVDEHLHTVTGRTFAPRAGRWLPDTDGYVLGHEELQADAVRMLGPARLAGYRDRLHAWADGYRDRHWPDGTPEYLLRGWFRLLHVTADVPRLLACATDPDRHHRLLDISGGDTAALAEITAVQSLLAERHPPDLAALARLAVHRSMLTARSSGFPVNLPTLWAEVGKPIRADAVARTIADPFWPMLGLPATVAAIGRAGRLDLAEALARSVEEPYRSQALAVVVTTVVETGDVDLAEALAWVVPSRTGGRRPLPSWWTSWPPAPVRRIASGRSPPPSRPPPDPAQTRTSRPGPGRGHRGGDAGRRGPARGGARRRGRGRGARRHRAVDVDRPCRHAGAARQPRPGRRAGSPHRGPGASGVDPRRAVPAAAGDVARAPALAVEAQTAAQAVTAPIDRAQALTALVGRRCEPVTPTWRGHSPPRPRRPRCPSPTRTGGTWR